MLPELSRGPDRCWDVGGRMPAPRLKGGGNWKAGAAGDGMAEDGGRLCWGREEGCSCLMLAEGEDCLGAADARLLDWLRCEAGSAG